MRLRYRPTHINSAQTAVPVLPLFNTTTTTAISPGLRTITLTSMNGILPWSYAWIYGGTGTIELVQILGGLVPPSGSGITQPSQIYTGVDYVNSKVTCFFQNSHSGTNNFVCNRMNEIGPLVVGTPAASDLKIYNGPPAAAGIVGDAGTLMADYANISSDQFFPDLGLIYYTLYYTSTGAGFDLTLWDCPHGP